MRSFGAAADIAAGRKPQVIDVAETGAATDRPLSDPFLDKAALVQPVLQSLRGLIDRIKRPAGLELPPLQPAPMPLPDIVPAGGKFIEATYANAAGRRTYKLYIPSRYAGARAPARRSLWSSCCTAAASRPTISPPARA